MRELQEQMQTARFMREQAGVTCEGPAPPAKEGEGAGFVADGKCSNDILDLIAIVADQKRGYLDETHGRNEPCSTGLPESEFLLRSSALAVAGATCVGRESHCDGGRSRQSRVSPNGPQTFGKAGNFSWVSMGETERFDKGDHHVFRKAAENGLPAQDPAKELRGVLEFASLN